MQNPHRTNWLIYTVQCNSVLLLGLKSIFLLEIYLGYILIFRVRFETWDLKKNGHLRFDEII